MSGKMMMTSMVMICCMSLNSLAKGAEAPKITSWSNSKTSDSKTVFAVKPGEKITFSVKTEGAKKYQWMVNKATQKETENDSFTWTVPNKKGMWKICVKTTNKARQQWVKQKAVFWKKWLETSEQEKKFQQEKEKFLREMIDIKVYPTKSRTEWIVSAFLIKVKPGESIQKAIDSVPAEGGIVELVQGTHEVNDATYPPGAFKIVYGKKSRMDKYSIIIKRNNVTIYGSHQSVVRHHNKDVHCFLVPDVGNITFRGFATTSAYTRKDRPRNTLITGFNVKNFTVEDMHDTSWAKTWVRAGGWYPKYGENVSIKNNIMEHCSLGFSHIRTIRVLDNTILGARQNYALGTDQRLSNLFVIGNRVINAGANSGTQLDSPRNALYCDNYVKGSQASLRLNHGGTNTLIENNTFTEATRFGIRITSQFKSQNVLIRNNRIYNSRRDGIFTLEPYSRASATSLIVFTNNIIYNCGRDGIRTEAEHRALDVSNNIIVNCKGFGINHTKGRITLSHNDFWNNGQGNYSGCAAGPGDFSKDPLFTDPTNGDFHLKSKAGRWDPKAKKWVKDAVHSPCIDAGNPKAKCLDEPDPNGGRVNIGAYGNTKEASKSTAR